MPYKERGKWRGTKMINGVRRTKTFKGKAQALRWEAVQSEEGWSQEASKISTMSLVEWSNEYLDFAKAKFSTAVYHEKALAFSRLEFSFDKAMPVKQLTPKRCLAHLNKLKSLDQGVRNDWKNLKAAWNWGEKYLGFEGKNPFRVDGPSTEQKLRYVPPVEDFWRVYEAAETEQDRVMLLAFYHTAARRGELFRLKWQDIDFDLNKLRLGTRKRKSGKLEYDWISLFPELKNVLLWWKANCPNEDSEYVFTVTGGRHFENQYEGQPYKKRLHFMRRLCEKARVKYFGFHSIRHLTASLLDQAGKPLTFIQNHLRHKSPMTTARYLHQLGGLRPDVENALPGMPDELAVGLGVDSPVDSHQQSGPARPPERYVVDLPVVYTMQ